MKKIIFVTLISLVLTACSASETSQTISDSINESEITTSTETSETDYISPLESLNAIAESQAKESFEITSGELYDSINRIYSNVKIYNMVDSINVKLYLDSDTPDNDSLTFFALVKEILNECKIESEFSSITFSLYVDEKNITIFLLDNYFGPSSFISRSPTVFNDDYKESISNIYKEFSSNTNSDIFDNFDKALEELKEKYNIR